jgi:2,3-bisphosphoglycerate-dependent phosphoglycerate mutase
MRLYLVRHAQSANNVLWDGVGHGNGRSPDPEITETGHKQADLLGRHIASSLGEPYGIPFNDDGDFSCKLTHLYCSLMTRSISTAEYIARSCNLDLHALSDIFELEGIFEFDKSGKKQGLPGPDRHYFEKRFPQLNLPQDFNNKGWWNRTPENHEEFLTRVRSVITNLKNNYSHTEDCIAMVTHGDFIDQFINELMNVPRHSNNYKSDWDANWAFHNTSISRVDFERGSHTVVYLNRITHLPENLITW